MDIILNQEDDDELLTSNLEPGEYDFHSAIYPFMTGKLKVVEE